MAENKKTISKKALHKAFWNFQWFSHSCYNYERFQGVSLGQALYWIFKDLYDTPEEIGREMEKHMVFFNTEVHVGDVIPGVVCAMEEERANNPDEVSPEAINALKTGLMGPFAGVGDTITQGIITPLCLSIGIGIALDGNFLGPIFHVLVCGGLCIGIAYFMWMYGYKWGREAVSKILEGGLMDKIIYASSILGCMVIGALGAANVHVSTPIVITLATVGEEVKTMSLQSSLFDSILTNLLPLLTILGVTALYKKGFSSNKIIGLLFVVGFILGAVGILG